MTEAGPPAFESCQQSFRPLVGQTSRREAREARNPWESLEVPKTLKDQQGKGPRARDLQAQGPVELYAAL